MHLSRAAFALCLSQQCSVYFCYKILDSWLLERCHYTTQRSHNVWPSINESRWSDVTVQLVSMKRLQNHVLIKWLQCHFWHNWYGIEIKLERQQTKKEGRDVSVFLFTFIKFRPVSSGVVTGIACNTIRHNYSRTWKHFEWRKLRGSYNS